VFLEPAIVILLTTIILAGLSKILQRKFIDKKKMKQMQEEIKQDNVKFKGLLKEAEKNKKEIEELQSKMMEKNMALMNSNMKLSLFTMPAFLVSFWFLSTLYSGQTIESFIMLPKFSNFFMLNPLSWIPIGLTQYTGFYKAYFFYYLGSAIVLGFIENIYDKYLKK